MPSLFLQSALKYSRLWLLPDWGAAPPAGTADAAPMAEAPGDGRAPDWAKSRGRPTCERGMPLLSGDPPAGRFAKG
jgi:hypothetical protein